jgi:NDP-sugar pyrophosphorylase family protein
MKAVILAGGLGTRLKPFTNVIPKPLMPIGEKAILEIQIEQLVHYGFTEIYLATNYKADYIEKFLGDGSRYGAQLIISKEDYPLGTAGPLKLLENRIKEPFLVMNGDILSLVDFKKFYDFSIIKDSLFTVAIKKIIMPYAFGNIYFNGDIVTAIEEKPNMITYAVAGIYIMKPGIFSLIPSNTYYGIDNLIQSMLNKKLPVTKYEIEEYWIDIGRVDDYEEIQEISDAFSSK